MAYKDISRGVRLAADHAKYMAWLNKDTEARQAAFAAINNSANTVKTARVPGYIIPFDASGANLVYIPTRLISATQAGRGAALAQTLKGIVDEYTFSTSEVQALTTPNILEGVKKFKCAKLTVIQRVTTATTKESSRITGRKYFRHENDSVTANFGKKLSADTYDSVCEAIREKAAFVALFTGSENAAASRYRFVPEGA
ncbi:hypothetical protein I8748_16440 [Nostoc sp. CENA67]|uniref:Uncharacterized protein n=1 Tax=Amazonocrinis nigriterrae CENA67 TaxID=2794033 RepID=A0A8J7HTC0_9NOST|nr:hypothetical protein [Amazonocrinis nigriterrae]MBH8563760.1 hypothetical protein [Amazonocrinis nigriterrae CENA67]